MNKSDIKIYQLVSRIILGCILVTLILFRVDWTVALFAFLMLIRTEVVDHFKQTTATNHTLKQYDETFKELSDK